jgi:hypothetical protein
LRLRADRHLHEIALMAEDLVLSEDFGDRLVGRPDHEMTARTAALIKLRPRQRRPAALASDPADHLGVRPEERVDRGFSRVGQEAVAVDADGEGVRRLARAAGGLAVEFSERRKPRRFPADDRDRQRQAERAGARDRLRLPPDTIQTGSGCCRARG